MQELWLSATQSRKKNFNANALPVRARHFVASSYDDLRFLTEELGHITTASHTTEVADRTQKGDCCIMSVIEWGHSRLNLFEEKLSAYWNDEEWMNHVGEFEFDVNEICLHADHNIFNLGEKDTDSHNPILVHLSNQEKKSYLTSEYKQTKAQNRKERQKENRKRGYHGGSAASSSTQHRRVYG